MLALEWLSQARVVMDRIEATQLENIRRAAAIMADSIAADRWVHTFGCGHATIPVEEMYPRIGGFWDRFRPMASGSHRIDWWRTKEQEKSGRKRNETNHETPICPHEKWPLHGALAETGGLRGRGADCYHRHRRRA